MPSPSSPSCCLKTCLLSRPPFPGFIFIVFRPRALWKLLTSNLGQLPLVDLWGALHFVLPLIRDHPLSQGRHLFTFNACSLTWPGGYAHGSPSSLQVSDNISHARPPGSVSGSPIPSFPLVSGKPTPVDSQTHGPTNKFLLLKK